MTDDGAVRIRLEGNCSGCPSSRVTLHSTIEEELYAAAPDITSLEVDDATDLAAPAAANRVPAFTEGPLPNGNGSQLATGENQ